MPYLLYSYLDLYSKSKSSHDEIILRLEETPRVYKLNAVKDRHLKSSAKGVSEQASHCEVEELKTFLSPFTLPPVQMSASDGLEGAIYHPDHEPLQVARCILGDLY